MSEEVKKVKALYTIPVEVLAEIDAALIEILEARREVDKVRRLLLTLGSGVGSPAAAEADECLDRAETILRGLHPGWDD